jgi:hypothetical protein
MGRIKSALEIALERTETVKSDKGSIEQFDAKQQGKKLANIYLADEKCNLAEEIKKTEAQQRESLKQGIFDVLVSQISLPVTAEDDKRIESVGKGLETVINNSRFTAMYKQLIQIMGQYLKELGQYEQAIKQQYAPKLRKKEEEISRRMGREVRIDPFQDPEFVGFFNQHMNALKGNYQTAVDQVKEEARKLFDHLR